MTILNLIKTIFLNWIVQSLAQRLLFCHSVFSLIKLISVVLRNIILWVFRYLICFNRSSFKYLHSLIVLFKSLNLIYLNFYYLHLILNFLNDKIILFFLLLNKFLRSLKLFWFYLIQWLHMFSQHLVFIL